MAAAHLAQEPPLEPHPPRWALEIQIQVDFSASDKNNGGIDGIVQRLPAAEMSVLPQPGTRDTHRARSSAIQRLPHHLPFPASHHTKRLQHVESMCTLRAKISDRVAEVQTGNQRAPLCRV